MRIDRQLLDMTAEIVVSYAGRNTLAADRVPHLLREVHQTLSSLDLGGTAAVDGRPAVALARSITPHAVICLQCGKRLKALKRHLWAAHQLSLDQYRARWKLASDYPMVAPSYAKRRSELARSMGLGTETGRGRKKRSAPAPAPGA